MPVTVATFIVDLNPELAIAAACTADIVTFIANSFAHFGFTKPFIGSNAAAFTVGKVPCLLIYFDFEIN